jgi:hypothetical protein
MTKSFGAGGGDVYLLKTNADREEQWYRTFGGTSYDRAFAVQQTADGGYIIAGETSSMGYGGKDIYLVKTDASGNLEWHYPYGGAYDDYAQSVVQTSDGGYVVTGYTGSYGNYGDVVIMKVDADGDMLWVKHYGGSDVDKGWSIKETADGGFIIAGHSYSFGTGLDPDIYIIRTDANGDTLWTRVYGDTDDEVAYGVDFTPDGGYVFAGFKGLGYPFKEYDVYLMKTNSAGSKIWDSTFGLDDDDYARSIKTTANGTFYIAGSTNSFWSAGGYDVYVLHVDEDGDVIWEEAVGATYSDHGFSIDESTYWNGPVVAGYTDSFSEGPYDVLLVTYEECVGVTSEASAEDGRLTCHCEPNPFETEVSLKYAVPSGGDTRITIYNTLGRVVTTLDEHEKHAGLRVTIWDGKDEFGNEAPSGIYFVEIRSADAVASSKILRVK